MWRPYACLVFILVATPFKPSEAWFRQEQAISDLRVVGDAGPATQVDISFRPSKLSINMDHSGKLNYTIQIREAALSPEQLNSHSIVVIFKPVTLSPQFDIIHLNDVNATELRTELTLEEMRQKKYVHNSLIELKSTYIGHATVAVTDTYLLKSPNSSQRIPLSRSTGKLAITSIKPEGVLDKIFIYSVIVFIFISYINIGAQIDTDNVRRLMDTPRIVFVGLLIGMFVMPLASWVAGAIFFKDQPMYRIGSFIYACGPAASASVLWTVMFNADKELALGLWIVSTIGALITMPVMLYAIDRTIELENEHTIKVPYMNLVRTLLMLLVALIVGSRLVNCHKRAKQISQRIFRPLTMFVLLFIITFSSYVYWYIYRMFDWTITVMALIVTSATYIFSGLLGYCVHKDLDQMVTISISSTYRNSGVAFAALVVAFQPPDMFIAYVPCLTQVVSTSLIGLVVYAIKSLRDRYKV